MTKQQIQDQLVNKITARGIGILMGNEIRDDRGSYKLIRSGSLADKVLMAHGSEYVVDCIVEYGVTPSKA